jgi:hypothetical protein
MTRCLKMIVLCAAVALPAVASAHDRMPRGAAGRWVEYGYSTYPRGDYPPAYRAGAGYSGYYAPYWTPGPRVYVYPHGSRVWYGPSAAPGYDYDPAGHSGYAYGGHHHPRHVERHHGW